VAKVFDNGVLVVRDAPTREMGGPGLEFGRRRFEDEPQLAAGDVRDLRDELTDWLRRVGRDS
jgi:hypothetical protein